MEKAKAGQVFDQREPSTGAWAGLGTLVNQGLPPMAAPPGVDTAGPGLRLRVVWSKQDWQANYCTLNRDLPPPLTPSPYPEVVKKVLTSPGVGCSLT